MLRTELFLLGATTEKDEAFAVLEPWNAGWETMPCSKHGTTNKRRVGPLVLSRIPPGDGALWTWYGDLLVYDSLKRMIEAELTGCTFAPAAFSEGCPPPREPLWELRVTGFAGFASAPDRVHVRDECLECGTYSYTVTGSFVELIDLGKWDGSDLFTIWPFPLFTICTPKAARLLNSVHGLAAIPIDEFAIEGDSAAPGRPQAWLDDTSLERLMNDPDYLEVLMP